MHKKTSLAFLCLALFVLLAAVPAVAGPTSGPTGPGVSEGADGASTELPSWLDGLFSRLMQAFAASDDEPAALWSASKTAEEPPQPSPSDPETGFSPMAGPGIDPDG